MIFAKIKVNEKNRCHMIYAYCGLSYMVLVCSVGQVMLLTLTLGTFEKGLEVLGRSEDITMLNVASINACSACITSLLTSFVLWSQLYINHRSLSACRFLTFLNFLVMFQLVMEITTLISLRRINNSQLKTVNLFVYSILLIIYL